MGEWRLVADVGGTNVRFARSLAGGGLAEARSYPAAAFATFLDALEHYLSETGGSGGCAGAAVGAAGVVEAGVVELTNGTWRIAAGGLSRRLGGAPVRLVNDLEAVARFLPGAAPEEVIPLGGAARPAAPGRVMLAVNVGTGFGAAAVLRTGRGWITLAAEPGHMSLAGGGAAERPASVEDLLSGRGVAACHAARAGLAPGADRLDAPEIFARAARDPVARAVVEQVSDALGRCIGDLVLATGAWGGAFLCGSVVEGWRQVAPIERFRRAFEAKGAMSGRMRSIFTGVLARPDAALHGLALLAAAPVDDGGPADIC